MYKLYFCDINLITDEEFEALPYGSEGLWRKFMHACRKEVSIAAMMADRFGHDNLIALATVDGGSPAVRTVNAYYEDGCFYTITYAVSGKMQQIGRNGTSFSRRSWRMSATK